ncbi:MAG: hypothetical protein ACTSYN_00055 [Candidatus Heimdallarchaeaceae archaeon]
MNKRKILSLTLVLVMGLGCLGILSKTGVNGQEPAPVDEYIAPYNSAIIVDANLDDWENITENYVTLYNYSDPSGVPTLTVNYAFAYNDTHLFGYVFVPGSLGQVNALDWHFFGKPGQDDGFHLDAQNNWTMDMSFGDPEGPPTSDFDAGGVDDGTGAGVIISPNGTIFEFAKPLASGDTAGNDIDLYYGSSIAVEFFAWVGITSDANPPNYGISPPAELGYIRLSIGEDQGEELYLKPKFNPPQYWCRLFDLPFAYDDAISLNYDGQFTEPEWQKAIVMDFTLDYYEWDTGFWDYNKHIEAKIMLLYDQNNFYIGLTLQNPNGTAPPDKSFIGVALGVNEWFYDDPEGFDLVMVNGYGEADDTFMPGDHTIPISDLIVGGVNDYAAGATYDSNQFSIEISRPLATNDPEGHDADFYIGGMMYLAFVASFGYGPPNYISITPIDVEGHNEPAIVIYRAPIEPHHEEPPETIIGTPMDANYNEITSITLDGNNSEELYQNSRTFDVNLKYADFDSGIQTDNQIDLEIMLGYYSGTVAFWIKIGRALDDEQDWMGVMLSHKDNPFIDPEGADFVLISEMSYEDMWFDFSVNGEPGRDVENGGTTDGDGILVIDEVHNLTYAEFYKPLDVVDPNGHDITAQPGDSFYALFMLSWHSSDGGPNYFEVEIQPEQPPRFYVHQITLLKTATTGTTDTGNTFQIGFKPIESLVLLTLGVVVVPLIRKRTKIKKLK